jgi:hypothetical protein
MPLWPGRRFIMSRPLGFRWRLGKCLRDRLGPARRKAPVPLCKKFLGPLAVLLIASTSPSARADLIFLKDGTILQGKLIRESIIDYDPATHEPIRLPVGFYLIDEGARRFYFCQTQVAKVVKQEEGTSEVQITYPRSWSVPPTPVPAIHQVIETEPWNAKWDRVIRLRNLNSPTPFAAQQHLALITPRFARVDAITRYFWKNYYLTRELEPEMVQKLLETNPQYTDDPKLKEEERISRRFRICDFFGQTGWYDLAERNLAKLVAEFPSCKERVETAQASLRKLRTREQFELIKRMNAGGQYKGVKAALEAFPEKDATEETAAEFRTFKASYDETSGKYAETLRMLDVVAGGLKDAPEGLAAALTAVRAEMHPDRTNRLEAFLGQALQAERQRKAGRSPEVAPGGLAALAVTGWLLGGPSAEPKPETALRLWRSRDLVLDYLRADDAAAREKLMANYANRKADFAGLDEVCQMIPQLPPEAPQPDTKGAEIELKAGESRRGPLYLVKVPPEYSHNRLYPVLLALHATGEPAQFMLRRLEAICAENGYILVVPRWQNKANDNYAFSEREHQALFEVLRDVSRRFQIDSDRVFLMGVGFGGGDMAFDVGLSHPDLFAGVVPMAAGPSYYSEAYWRSAQYLPFYVINGDRSGDGNKKIREEFTNWMPRGFNSIWVQYKGRGVEWFGGELPSVFDWMRDKRRASPLHKLGVDGLGGKFGSEFFTMRQCDNRFYWLSTDEVESRRCNSVEGWNNRVVPATMTARIDPASNEIKVQTSGIRLLSIWLGRNAKGENMVDFDKPVTVFVGLTVRVNSRRITPSLDVLLKDLAERGDRQRLFLAKIDLKL